MGEQQHYRICPICEATCGLKITTDGRKVTAIRGNDEDVFSEGYLCTKGVALQDLDADPDRLRTPMIREGETWREATWDEAFEEIERRLLPIIQEHGKNALGAYLGNPGAHNTGLALYNSALLRTLGTRNLFSASTVDQRPKELTSAALFGSGLSMAIPDIDRCQYMLILGANPLESNGSLMTAPNFAGRLKSIQSRGGRFVVIDPKRTKTARLADEHRYIRPGTDAYFLFAIVHTLLDEGLADPGRLTEFAQGAEDIEGLAHDFSPETVADLCGIEAPEIRRIARELAQAESAAVYARIGTCTQEFGTLASWLPDIIHYLTGNLDREGGAMFTLPAHGPANTKGEPGIGRGLRESRHGSRVRNLKEIFGELPVACMSEEIDTPGEGQIRALITIAGNPVLSTPNGKRLDAALASLEFMISMDIYLNETTRHAHVILPGLSPLETVHYDMAFEALSVRNCARFSPAVFEKPDNMPYEWETVLRLTALLSGLGSKPDIPPLDDMYIMNLISRESRHENSPIHGRDPAEILQELAPRRGPERVLDLMVRTGPYGEGFGKNTDGLTLDKLEANPNGIDFGPLESRIPEMLRTASGKIELTPDCIVQDVARLKAGLSGSTDGLLLIGRRHLRSNNSWMHNLPKLVSGKPRCTLQMHPDDASSLGLNDGSTATITSKVGEITAPVELCDDMMPGVVSLPHGWGHGEPGVRMSVAADHAGVNTNLLTDENQIDIPSGNSVMCGIPVNVSRAEALAEDAMMAK